LEDTSQSHLYYPRPFKYDFNIVVFDKNVSLARKQALMEQKEYRDIVHKCRRIQSWEAGFGSYGRIEKHPMAGANLGPEGPRRSVGYECSNLRDCGTKAEKAVVLWNRPSPLSRILLSVLPYEM
jgi:hypothetical protein